MDVAISTKVRLLGHRVQVAFPVTDLNLPAAHSEHVSPSLPENPALHKQETALPTTEEEFPGQLLHAALPVVVLYFPAGHNAHATPSLPDSEVEPALHLQSSMELLPLIESLFVGHS